jgi:hypothetical protein
MDVGAKHLSPFPSFAVVGVGGGGRWVFLVFGLVAGDGKMSAGDGVRVVRAARCWPRFVLVLSAYLILSPILLSALSDCLSGRIANVVFMAAG